MEGFEPYAWQLLVTGKSGPDGVLYSGTSTGVDAYEDETVRAAIEDMAKRSFLHSHPGAEIASVRWYPLYDFEGDDE